MGFSPSLQIGRSLKLFTSLSMNARWAG